MENETKPPTETPVAKTKAKQQQESPPEITKTMAIPPRGRKPYYPWKDLEVGQTFIYPKKGTIVAVACNRAEKRYGIKLTYRVEGDGCRVWREG